MLYLGTTLPPPPENPGPPPHLKIPDITTFAKTLIKLGHISVRGLGAPVFGATFSLKDNRIP